MFDTLNLTGKTALVTGANKGIGYGIATLLKLRGAIVIATARSDNDIGKLTQEGFIANYLDVTKVESIDALKEYLLSEEKMPDILVNNAGIGSISLLAKQSSELWNETINTNLNSCFEVSKRFLPTMSKRKYGRVINLSSVLSHFPQKGFAHYSASKAGIEGYTKAAALEYASKKVTVNAVCPGFVDTDMLDCLGEKGKNMAKNSIPAGRMGSPKDVAELVAFLASEAAEYITGESIHINGGLYTN